MAKSVRAKPDNLSSMPGTNTVDRTDSSGRMSSDRPKCTHVANALQLRVKYYKGRRKSPIKSKIFYPCYNDANIGPTVIYINPETQLASYLQAQGFKS